jgi:lysophospholipase
MLLKQENYIKFDKYTICYRIYRGKNTSPNKGFLFLHGRGVHSRYLEHLIDDVFMGKYAFFSFDYPGHGRSSGPRCNVDLYRILPAFIEYFIDRIMIREGIRQVFLLGESLGSLVAFFTQHKLRFKIACKALIFMPGIYEIKEFNSKLKLFFLHFLKVFAPWLKLKNKRPLHQLTDVQEYQDLLLHDSHIHRFGSIRYFYGIYRFFKYMRKNMKDMCVPLLIFSSRNDHYTDEKVVTTYFHNRFPAHPYNRLVFVENSRHWLLMGGDVDVIKKELFRWCESIP